jgi:prenyltransferase beta subunit
LPAPKYPLKAAIWIIILLTVSIVSQLHYANATAMSQASATKSALSWLSSKQKADGSYGAFSQISTAPAAYALWLNNSRSPKAAASYSWLASQMDNSSSDLWAYPEADIPGEIFYALSVSNNLGLIHNSSDTVALLSMQGTNGGFSGYYDSSGQVASSVDTAMALLGLVHARAISDSKRDLAISYLLSLQNTDGSFKLTSTISSSNSTYSLGPEPISVTALVLLVLRDASYSSSNNHVSSALNFLETGIADNFTITHDHEGHVYAAAVSALALNAFGRIARASEAISFVLSQQNSDGGFRDADRFSSGSNALDTGWAAMALQEVQPGPFFGSFLSPRVLVGVIILIGVVAVVVVVAVYVLMRRRLAKPTSISGTTATLSTY